MIKKRKKMLFVFIVIVIAVLLFSVVGIITVYLSGPTNYVDTSNPEYQQAYQEALQEAQDALSASGAIQLQATDSDGNIVNLTGNVVEPSEVWTWS